MKITFVKYISLTVAVLFVFGCAEMSPSETAAQLQQKKYFDLEGYFKNEVKRLDAQSNFTKTTYLNGESEERQVEKIDFEKELVIFSDSDINRPAWSDKYEVDSVFNKKKELVQLNYEANDEKLRTRQISIDVNGGVVSKIQIENATKTSVANTQQSLTYEPAKGYAIESRQQVKTIDNAVLRIEVSF